MATHDRRVAAVGAPPVGSACAKQHLKSYLDTFRDTFTNLFFREPGGQRDQRYILAGRCATSAEEFDSEMGATWGIFRMHSHTSR
jgi:hypothetical protein